MKNQKTDLPEEFDILFPHLKTKQRRKTLTEQEKLGESFLEIARQHPPERKV